MPASEPFHPMFRFVLAGLATWRLGFLLAREDGPGKFIARFRDGLGSGLAGSLMGCVKCVSVWVAVPFAMFVGGDRTEQVVSWLALAGVAALIDEWTRPPFEWQEGNANELLRPDPDRPSD
jgi:hypothetical protein